MFLQLLEKIFKKQKTKPYYALRCMQNDIIMHSGRNTRTIDDLKEGLLDFISSDFLTEQPEEFSACKEDIEDYNNWIKLTKADVKSIASWWDFKIIKQDIPIVVENDY